MDSGVVVLELFVIFHHLELNNSRNDPASDPDANEDPEVGCDFKLLSFSDVRPDLTLSWISIEEESQSPHEHVRSDE